MVKHLAYHFNISGDISGRKHKTSSLRGSRNRPIVSCHVLQFELLELMQRLLVFLLAFAYSVPAQLVQLNSSLGSSENPYAEFSYPLMREKECNFRMAKSNIWKKFLCPLPVRPKNFKTSCFTRVLCVISSGRHRNYVVLCFM